MTNTPVNPKVELLIDGQWRDVTADCRLSSADSGGGITITRGIPNEGNRAEPTTVELTLNNGVSKAPETEGQVAVYSPKNPNGPWYGKLGRNQPLRVDLDRREDDFDRTEVYGWGRLPSWVDPEWTTRQGERWELTGTATNFNVTPGAATIQSATGTQSATYGKQYSDVEVLAKIRMSDRTSETGVMLRFASTYPDQADGTFESGLSDWQVSGGTLTANTVTVREGLVSAQATVSGSPSSLTLRPVAARRVPVVAGGSYRQRGRYRVSTTLTVKQTFEWYDANGNLISTLTSTGSVLTSGGWYSMEYSVTAPVGACYVSYGPTIDGSPANGSWLLVDELTFLDFDSLAWYSAYIAPQTAPSADRLRIGKVVPGQSSVAYGADWDGGNYLVDTDYWIKAQATGHRFRLKFWADGDDEPTTWGLTNYDNRTEELAGPTTGQAGVIVAGGTCLLTVKEISVRQWRAHAEVTQLPPRWDLSRADRWVPITAKGILRRLGQGRKELNSAVTLHLRRYTPSALWFPLESSAGGVASNLVPTGLPGFLRDVTFSDPDTEGTLALPGVSGIATFDQATSQINGQAIDYTETDDWTFLFFWRIPAAPASDTLWFQCSSTGTIRTWSIYVTSGFDLRIEGKAADNSVVVNDFATPYQVFPDGVWISAVLTLVKDGSNVDWAFNYTQPGSDLGFFTANGTYAGKAGKFRSFRFNTGSVLSTAGGFQLTQCFHYAGDLPFVTYEFARVAKAYLEESAGSRWTRLTTDNNIPASTMGSTGGTELMSAQLPAKLLDLLDETAEAEGTWVYEERGEFAIGLHTKLAVMNQEPLELDLDAGHVSAPSEPIEDDQATRNHVTVSRPAGGFAVSVQETGPLNVNEPEDDPDGVGIYAEQPELPLGNDGQLQAAADWRRAVGTLDEARYPALVADLTSSAYQEDEALTALALAMDAGRTIELTNPEVDPDPAPQLVRSYTETLDQYAHTLNWVTTPGRLWRVGVVGNSSPNTRYRDELRVQPAGLLVQTAFVVGTDRFLKCEVDPAVENAGLWYPTADDRKVADFDVLAAGVRLRLRHVGQGLETDGDFESASSFATSWEASGAGFTAFLDQNNPKNGSYCGRVLAAGAGTGGLNQTQAANATTVAGQVYAVFGWIKTEAAATDVRLAVDFYQSDGTTFVSTPATTPITTVANEWTWFSALVTAPALGVRARVKVRNVFAGATNLWVDDVRLVPQTSYNTTPQTVTVDLAPVNGVYKTIPVGSRITLGKPGRVAWNI